MLKTRILSALVLAPLAIGAVWYGGWAFRLLVLAATVIMIWEWQRIVTGKAPMGLGAMILYATAASALGIAHRWPVAALVVVAIGTFAVALGGRFQHEKAVNWLALGVPYIVLPAVALLWLRTDKLIGRETVFFILFVVWATDIGAYAFGRLIGGPKLAPRLSPKKTWAGLLGGMACAALTGWACGVWAGSSQPLLLGLIGGGLAVVAQAGDIAESAVKRRFDVKDSSNIIPGHGGVLDRVDGVLPVAALVALVVALTSGGGW